MQQTLYEQVVDVDSDVMVIEWQIDRSINGQTVWLLDFTNTRCPFGCLLVKEDRPSLLKECEECLPVSNQFLKRPVIEGGALAQELDEPLVQHRRNALAAVVTS